MSNRPNDQEPSYPPETWPEQIGAFDLAIQATRDWLQIKDAVTAANSQGMAVSSEIIDQLKLAEQARLRAIQALGLKEQQQAHSIASEQYQLEKQLSNESEGGETDV